MFSRSSLLEKPAFLPRARPTASISSMKTMQGAFSFACRNRSRTRDAPTPTNISTKSEPEIEKNGTFASPATAFASRVLPVPGGPTRRAPLGIFPPSAVYFWGFFRKSTISITSSLAPYSPATSLKVTLTLSLSASFPVARPTLKMPPPGPPGPAPFARFMPRNIQTHISTSRRSGRIISSALDQKWLSLLTTTFTCASAGSPSFRAPNSFSASNLSDTRKMKCGERAGTLPPNLSAYLASRSGRTVTSPL